MLRKERVNMPQRMCLCEIGQCSSFALSRSLKRGEDNTIAKFTFVSELAEQFSEQVPQV